MLIYAHVKRDSGTEFTSLKFCVPFAHGKLLPRLSVKEPGYPLVYGQNSVTSMHEYPLGGSLDRYKTRTRTTLHTYQTIVAIAVPICKWVDLVRVLYLPVLFCIATGIHCSDIQYSSNSKTRLNGKISGLDKNKHTGYSSTWHKRPEKVPQSFAAHSGITFISCVS